MLEIWPACAGKNRSPAGARKYGGNKKYIGRKKYRDKTVKYVEGKGKYICKVKGK